MRYRVNYGNGQVSHTFSSNAAQRKLSLVKNGRSLSRDELSILGAKLVQTLEAAGVPFTSTKVWTLGEPSLHINLSLDDPKNWANGIYQNSRYAQFAIDSYGEVLEVKSIAGSLTKLRKKRFELTNSKSWEDIAEYVLKWLQKQK